MEIAMYHVIMAMYLHSTFGQVSQKGKCEEGPENIVADLDIPAFMGTWYQIARIPNTYEVGNCSMTSFKLMSPGSGDILVVEKEVTDDGRILERYGNITFSHGRFNSNFDKIKPDYYWVAGEYDDYALLYSCENVDHDIKQVWGWMLSRTREMSPVGQEGLPDAVVTASDLHNLVAWTWTDQGDYCERRGMAE